MRHDIGHLYIDSECGRFEFYPTFKNIRNICEPEQIVSMFADINGQLEHKAQLSAMAGMKNLSNIYMRSLYQCCALVMQSCCDDDITKLIGRIKWERGAKHFQIGVMPLNHMIAFSKVLLKHGLIGVNDGKQSSGDKCDTVDVYDFVRIAMTHLGLTQEQAENLTKTELDKLMNVKFPEQKTASSNAPSDDDYYKAMELLDKIDAKRIAK